MNNNLFGPTYAWFYDFMILDYSCNLLVTSILIEIMEVDLKVPKILVDNFNVALCIVFYDYAMKGKDFYEMHFPKSISQKDLEILENIYNQVKLKFNPELK